jgi:transposase InsO family protein
LELTAATVGSKLSRFVLKELDFHDISVYFWTDSMTVLRFLRNVSTRFKVFVAHRVQQIQDLTDITTWNYVPTDQNPADLASRGINPDESEKLEFWLKGPKFLQSDSSYARMFEEPTSEQVEMELRQSCAAETFADLQALINRFSSLHKLQRSASWLLKFTQHVRKQPVPNELNVTEMEVALTCLIRFVQKRALATEWSALRAKKPVLASSKLRKLNPEIIEGLICVGGRLNNSSAEVSKHPIILPDNHLTRLIIRAVHEKNEHVGSNHTISILRRKYYIIQCYSMVKTVLNSCVTCKKHHGKQMQQVMGNLPRERVNTDVKPPFTFTGVDYFGPFNVKFRRGTVKRYGVLFTCLTTRAVHLEVAHALSSDSFLMALHRFMARRGKPQKILSDNGTNFVAAEKELADEIQAINSKKLRDELLVEAIEWSFNPPHAPHMGGVWERLVKSVKTLLRHLAGSRLLTDEELVSFLCEAEKILNDRPLTRMGSDHRDPTPLTPSDLLLVRGNTCAPDTEGNNIRRRWQVVQKIANAFYERFVSEYLPQLQVRSKWTEKKENLKVNDIVLVAEEDTPRGQWPLGIVKEIEHSSDGQVRAATVRFNNKEKRRAIHKLVLLEHHDDN